MNITYNMSDFYQLVSDNNNIYKSQNKEHKTVLTADSNVEDMQEDITTLRKKIRSLKSYHNNTYVESKLSKQLESFKDAYNELKEKYDSVSDNEKLSKELNKLENLISDNMKSLKKVGIKYNDKGYLTYDSEKLEDVEDSTLETLFSGNDSFISKANKIVGKIEDAANDTAVKSERVAYHRTVSYSDEELQLAYHCADVQNVMIGLSAENTIIKGIEDTIADIENSVYIGVYQESVKYRTAYQESFVELYNTLLEKADESTVKQMKELSSMQKDTLNAIGLSFDESGKMEIAEDVKNISKDVDFTTNIEKLFGENATYREGINSIADELLNKTLKTEKLGITIDITV